MWKVKLFGMNDNVVGFLNDNNIRNWKPVRQWYNENHKQCIEIIYWEKVRKKKREG